MSSSTRNPNRRHLRLVVSNDAPSGGCDGIPVPDLLDVLSSPRSGLLGALVEPLADDLENLAWMLRTQPAWSLDQRRILKVAEAVGSEAAAS